MDDINIGILIPIRLASTRLPNKAILQICEKPVIHHLLDRAFASKFIDKKRVVVCTTTDPSDDLLVEYAESYGASIFRGHSDDIIKRLYDAMQYYEFDYAAQIDGDDICAEPFYVDHCLSTLIENDSFDVVSVSGLPIGITSRSFTFKAMKEIFIRYKSSENDTGFGSYFTKSDFLNYKELQPISNNHSYERVRLTLDYEEDFAFFEIIFNKLYSNENIFDLDAIINLLKKEPEISETNYFLQEEYMNRFNEKRNLKYQGLDGEVKSI